MKNLIRIKATSVLLLVFFLGLGEKAQAIPILGYADPGYGNGYDPLTTTTGTVNYNFFNVDDPLLNYNLVSLTLTFEGDVFDLANTWVNLTSLPTGWNVSTLGGSAYEFANVYGLPGIPEGNPLGFSATYTLLGPAGSLPWDEGGAWQQGFSGVLLAGSGNPVGAPYIMSTGGATAAPEPTSLLLLGSGLAGLGLLSRKKAKLNKV